jgi:hypothetical protein
MTVYAVARVVAGTALAAGAVWVAAAEYRDAFAYLRRQLRAVDGSPVLDTEQSVIARPAAAPRRAA